MKFRYTFRLLLSMLLFGATWQMILRLPCGDVFADFTIFLREKALNGSVIATISNTNDVQCMVKCVEHHKCRSYNTQIDQKKCELNSKAIGDKDAVLISKPGWVYKSTDYNATQVGDTCQELNPCHADILCRDKCDYPFYECVYCDESHYGLHCDKLKDLDECRNKPCKNNATCVDLKSSYSCKCIPGFTGVNCETEIDECDCLPCFNGGECKNEANKYSCKCASGYEGTNCEKDIDDCKGQPCQNGGGCVDKLNGYICNCVPGFKGTNCTININECSSNPCQNNATCNDAANGYSCGCLPGYKGMHCETNIDECNGDPCLNGGACTDGINEFTCKCALGYEGNTCNTNIDDCHSNPCQNGGKCKDLVNKFACECKAGSSGSLCEIDFDECSSYPCKNGATCVNGANKFTCTCLAGYEGKLCHPKCGATITGNSGEIISKNYPNNYPNNLKCFWKVTVAVGSRIRVVFNYLNVEPDYTSGCYDHVRLFSGLVLASPALTGKLCGTTIPPITTTTGNDLLVQFVTDAEEKRKGFNLTWTVQP